MSSIDGGLRDRFLTHSLVVMVRDALGELGWYDPDRAHAPLQEIRTERVPKHVEIPFNTIVCVAEDIDHDDIELGSYLSEDIHTHFFEMYCESDALMRHLRGDLEAILRGKHPTAGRTTTRLEIFDWSLATPAVFAYAELLNVRSERTLFPDRPWEENMASVRVDVVEEH